MAAFIAERIKDARDACGLSAGQVKYSAYFAGNIQQMLYGKYQSQVDMICNTDGYADCILVANN